MTILKKGMVVRLSETCSHTRASFAIATNMKQYFGTIQKINKIQHILGKTAVRIQNYSWDPRDLTLITPSDIKKEMKPVLFNENELLGESK